MWAQHFIANARYPLNCACIPLIHLYIHLVVESLKDIFQSACSVQVAFIILWHYFVSECWQTKMQFSHSGICCGTQAIPYTYKFLRDVIFKVFVVNLPSVKFSSSKFHGKTLVCIAGYSCEQLRGYI